MLFLKWTPNLEMSERSFMNERQAPIDRALNDFLISYPTFSYQQHLRDRSSFSVFILHVSATLPLCFWIVTANDFESNCPSIHTRRQKMIVNHIFASRIEMCKIGVVYRNEVQIIPGLGTKYTH